MDFRISDTFTDSLSRLTGEEQKLAKTTAFDLQLSPTSPGMSFHKLDRARDKNFWSVRVSSDIRLIVHKTEGSLLLCYVGHHDNAYDWAARRKLETHPTTGAAQLVEIRETVQEIVIPSYVEAPQRPRQLARLFASVDDIEMLGYGVPPEWLADVRSATEDSLLNLVGHLPGEAAEALLELATGGRPRAAVAAAPVESPFDHPDAQRRFRVMANVEELEQALAFPWDKWTVFLHPEQRQWVERDYSGPARVSGSAGTGKTIVALHRAAFLARNNPDARILLTTFSEILANDLQSRINRLVHSKPQLAERIDVYSIDAIGKRLYKSQFGHQPNLATPETISTAISTASQAAGRHKFTQHFLNTEWGSVVDAWQLASWEDYRDVSRIGRKTRLPEPQRAILWSIFERVIAELDKGNVITYSRMFARLTEMLNTAKHPPFDFAIVDEAQDVGVSHLRFFAALGSHRPDALFFSGDLGQRIFQQPFSWKSVGVDIRGRSRTLRVNYRTSHQIRVQADRLLSKEVSDVDGNTDERGDTISVFNGPPPAIQTFKTREEEIKAVSDWFGERIAAGLLPSDIAVFVRSSAQILFAEEAVRASGHPFKELSESVETTLGSVSIGTMHVAKGLEFRAVAVIACDDEIIPLQERIESVGDDADLREVYDTERQLLYVACTRARDFLLVTSVEPRSEFLDDLRT